MTCPAKLEPLNCSQTGVGFSTGPLASGGGTITLQAGQGQNFPTPTDGKVFYVDVGGCGCCTRLKVTRRVGDVLTLEPGIACACIQSGARVAYASNSPEHMRLAAAELPFNAVPPLYWNCETRTLHIDCEELKAMVAMPCA